MLLIEKLSWRECPILAVTQRQNISLSYSGRAVYRNLLRSLANNFDLRFHAVINDIDDRGISSEKIEVVRLSEGKVNFSHIPVFYAKLLKHSVAFLRKHKGSLIHHMFFLSEGFESFDLLAVSGRAEGHPLLIGPAEAPHPFFEDDFSTSTTTPRLPKAQYHLMKGIRNALGGAFKAAFQRTMDECDLVTVYNEGTKRVYSRSVSSKKIKVIPAGVELDEFRFSPPPMTHIVLSVGSLIRRKNFHCLIRAMAKVRKEYSDASLQIIGDGPQGEALSYVATKAGFPSAMRGRVLREELLDSYRACRVFCQVSLAESFSTTILEAMACGRPVVSTKTVGSEMVQDGRTGFLVPVNDSDAIADRIICLFGDDDLTYRMGLEGRRTAEKKHNWVSIARDYYLAYKEIGDVS